MSAWTAADIPDQSGRTALVTGASGGIGLEVTRQLCDEGARVIMVSRDPEQLAAMAEVVRAEGGEVEIVVKELTKLSGVEIDASSAMDNEVLVIRVKGVPLKE